MRLFRYVRPLREGGIGKVGVARLALDDAGLPSDLNAATAAPVSEVVMDEPILAKRGKH
jgi:hypothetical protein